MMNAFLILFIDDTKQLLPGDLNMLNVSNKLGAYLPGCGYGYLDVYLELLLWKYLQIIGRDVLLWCKGMNEQFIVILLGL